MSEPQGPVMTPGEQAVWAAAFVAELRNRCQKNGTTAHDDDMLLAAIAEASTVVGLLREISLTVYRKFGLDSDAADMIDGIVGPSPMLRRLITVEQLRAVQEKHLKR